MSSALNSGSIRRRPAVWVTGVFACLALQACSKSLPDRLGAPIEGYNHTSAAINYFMVNGNGGPNIGPFDGGGSQTCCASMPRQWRPGLTVVVEWEKDPNVGASRYWIEPRFSDAWFKRMDEHESKYTRHRAVVEVAAYEQLGLVNVHFLPCDQVKVAASPSYLGRPNHPYNYPLKMEVPPVCPVP
jgi:hypothetical protein